MPLREIYTKVEANMKQLEAWWDYGPVGSEGEIDEYHLRMLELYRSVYFTIKDSKLLMKQPRPKSLNIQKRKGLDKKI